MMRENTKKKTRSIEMVTGSLWKNIFLFSIPLMCSQLLEVVFNLSDVAVGLTSFIFIPDFVPVDSVSVLHIHLLLLQIRGTVGVHGSVLI